MINPGILVIDDEVKLCRNIALKLRREGFTVYEAYDGKAALRKFLQYTIRVVILDYMLTDMTGLEILKRIKELAPQTRVYMLTAYGNIENAVLAMKWGAEDYFNKPFDLKELAIIVNKAYQSLDELSGDIVFKSEKMKAVRLILERIKMTDAQVLLIGESGTGKSMLAKWIHEHSARKEMPFLQVNCGLISDATLERELFGSSGKVKAADGGTLYLNEISNLSPLLQGHLYCLLKDNYYICLDSGKRETVNVRIITSTIHHLQQLVKEGSYRGDLYFLLNLIEIELPTLRERKEDIPFLVDQKITQLNAKYGKPLAISAELLDIIEDILWLGNMNELMNMLERMHLLKLDGVLDVGDFPSTMLTQSAKSIEELQLDGKLYDVLEEVEGRMIVEALEKTRGNQSRAAELLGISRNSLIYKMKRIER